MSSEDESNPTPSAEREEEVTESTTLDDGAPAARTSRRARGKSGALSAKLSALEKLKKARSDGEKRSEQFELKEEPVYYPDSEEEEELAKLRAEAERARKAALLQKRRERKGALSSAGTSSQATKKRKREEEEESVPVGARIPYIFMKSQLTAGAPSPAKKPKLDSAITTTSSTSIAVGDDDLTEQLLKDLKSDPYNLKATKPLSAVASSVQPSAPPSGEATVSATVTSATAPSESSVPMDTVDTANIPAESTVAPATAAAAVPASTNPAALLTDEELEALFADTKFGESSAAAATESTSSNAAVSTSDYVDMYWMDVFEDAKNHPGSIFLFGKVAIDNGTRHASCCVIVHNMQRVLYIAPRDDAVSTAAVMKEFDGLRRQHGIERWAAKEVQRKYAFERDDVPRTGGPQRFVKVKYHYKFPPIPADTSGATFTTIFGTHTSALERFLLKRRLHGPCWVRVRGPLRPVESERQITWCRHEYEVDDLNQLTRWVSTPELAGRPEPPAPPLVVLCMNLKTFLNGRGDANEIAAVTGVVLHSVNADGPTPAPYGMSTFGLVRRIPGKPPMALDGVAEKTGSVVCGSERELLLLLVGKLARYDPDMLVGHNFMGFDLDVLLHRMRDCKVALRWSLLGRLKRLKLPTLQSGVGGVGESTWDERRVVAGRLVCDTYISAKEFLLHEKNYSLAELARTQLGRVRDEPAASADAVSTCFDNTAGVLRLLRSSRADAELVVALMMHLAVVPLSKQLSSLAGNPWSHTLLNGRAERVEYRLLHQFYQDKYVVPDKPGAPAVSNNRAAAAPGAGGGGKRKAQYTGGLVLAPKKGLYDNIVLLLDFNSLYPSIIQEYNICFTTVDRRRNDDGTWAAAAVPDRNAPQGVLPQLLRALVEARQAAKKAMNETKDPLKRQQYDVRQRAIKLIANSTYGCLGFAHSRFYAMPLAELITQKGREALQGVVDLATQKLNLDVLYGDTDSVMINTCTKDITEALAIGKQLQAEVNKRYRTMEIAIDAIFAMLLLLKKKKYAAVVINDRGDVVRRDTKGLDLVRRDWCELSREMGSKILDCLLDPRTPREQAIARIHTYLSEIGRRVRAGDIEVGKYVITKGLTKPPEEYADAKTQPHVQVALRLKQMGRRVTVGDHIEYVVCRGDDPCLAARAFPPDVVVKSGGVLEIDTDWYLSQQILPPIQRLCSPLEETDSARLAEALGLDPTKFAHRSAPSATNGHNDGNDMNVAALLEDDAARNVEKLYFTCLRCGAKEAFEGALRSQQVEDGKENNRGKPASRNGMLCPSCGTAYNPKCMANQLDLAVRGLIEKYYEGWAVCEEANCKLRTRQMVKGGTRCLAKGCRGHVSLEYSEADLHAQLLYYARLFDIDKIEKKQPGTLALLLKPERDAVVEAFRMMHAKMQATLERNARNFISLSEITRYCVLHV